MEAMIQHEDLKYFNPTLFAENVFPHQQFMPKSERAYMHYVLSQTREKDDPSKFVRNTPTKTKPEIFRWLEFLSGNPFGDFIKEYVDAAWPTITQQIASFSTLNVQIAGNNPYHNIKTGKMFLHYHPPRLDTGKSLTSTYITPIFKTGPATETFRYANLEDADKTPKPLNDIIAGSLSKLEAAEQIFKEWKDCEELGIQYQDIVFPESGTLLLRFDGARYVHSLEGIGDNVYVVLVFNDVIFNEGYDPAPDDDFAQEHIEDIK